jgi:REP element-mobilizing transposase RayT
MDYPKTPPRLAQLLIDRPLYFVTFGTHQRRACLANPEVFGAFQLFAQSAAHKGIAIGRFVIMPDHIHLFVRGQPDFVLSNWLGRLKQAITQAVWQREGGQSTIWQRGFFDHVLRSDESYSEKWQYVRCNPVRAGLVQAPEEWPYQGEFTIIDRA